MNKFDWKEGQMVERPYVEIDGVKHYVHGGTVNDGTPVTANNLNEMQNVINANIENEVEDSKTWTLLGQTSANAEIELPSNWVELYAIIRLGSSTSIFMPIITLRESAMLGNIQIRTGGYLLPSSNYGGSIYITDSATKAKTIECYENSQNILDSTITRWYYR